MKKIEKHKQKMIKSYEYKKFMEYIKVKLKIIIVKIQALSKDTIKCYAGEKKNL